ncbi:MAG: beta galactosidase jelly roll domain-containing protein [Bacteroidales bacterium]|nr:beta galactosidase jelly roll domain-containing protein [Bacteroidales bacterium]
MKPKIVWLQISWPKFGYQLKSILTKYFFIGFVLVSCDFLNPVHAEIRLPKLLSDGMVLQREMPVVLWGWASPGEKVQVVISSEKVSTKADQSGRWKVSLSARKAGGPYKLVFRGSNEIVLQDVWFGDVWLCSGQSNMELPMRRVSWVFPKEIEQANYPEIRYFEVPKKYNFDKPQVDLPTGKWISVNPQEVLNISAVAFFFATEIYKKYRIPIGIINASLGGSPIEAWLNEEDLKEFPKYLNEGIRFRDTALVRTIQENDRSRSAKWYAELQRKDKAYAIPGKEWFRQSIDLNGWQKTIVPGYWNPTPLGKLCGVVWFRKEIQIPDSLAHRPALLILGRIVDADSVFVNGKFVGTTSYQYPPRRYQIPEGLLSEGSNTIAVKIISNSYNGGFVPDKPYHLVIGNTKFELSGEWYYQVGCTSEPLSPQTFIQWKPMGLYNAMIAPLSNYRLKGVLWYQGESNVERAEEYEQLLTKLIDSWRTTFSQSQLPFIYVQLPNFLESKNEPSESKWALLREAQLKVLRVPNTAMAVTIDVGEWNDIHPLDKKTVGIRLALAARRLVYGDSSTTGSGPIFRSMEIIGNKVILTFSHVDGGLVAKDGTELRHFAIAGADGKFVWANAIIENDRVVVWHENIPHPVAVRYAWADNPDGANLYNREGLPASPFRTDSIK